MSILIAWAVYLEISLLLVLAYGLFRVTCEREWMPPAQAVRVGYWLLIGAVLLPMGMREVPKSALGRPRAQVFSGHLRSAEPRFTLQAVAAPGAEFAPRDLRVSQRVLGVFGRGLAGVVLGLLFLLGARIRRLHREISRLPVIRRIGRVSVRVSGDDPVAYSAWIPGRARVVLPMRLVTNRADFSLALRHELQHLRAGDTRWLYFSEILRAVFFWNPLVHGFARRLGDLQEYACDEFLVGRRKVSPREYGGCLLRAAELAMTPGWSKVRVGTTCMAATSHRSTLKRRIEMILRSNDVLKRKSSRVLAVGIAAIGLMSLATAAFAARSAVQDRALAMAEARAYALSAANNASLPISMNERVLDRLNFYVGTEEGRQMVREGLYRMPRYEAMIRRKTDEYGAPAELIAQAFAESAFENEVVSPPPARAAGIWQFIPETARKYGMAVTPAADDRLNPEVETDAAMRYLRDLEAEFHDWRLALLAYNSGERAIEKAIRETGSRDPWVIEATQKGMPYLSSVEAMVIVLKNPALAKM